MVLCGEEGGETQLLRKRKAELLWDGGGFGRLFNIFPTTTTTTQGRLLAALGERDAPKIQQAQLVEVGKQV